MDKKEVVQGFGAIWAYITSGKISFLEKFFVIGFVLAYIVSPVDLIPDVPVIGWLDDIGIGALFMAFCNHRLNSLQELETPPKNSDTPKEVIDVTPAESTKQAPPFFSFTPKDKTK